MKRSPRQEARVLRPVASCTRTSTKPEEALLLRWTRVDPHCTGTDRRTVPLAGDKVPWTSEEGQTRRSCQEDSDPVTDRVSLRMTGRTVYLFASCHKGSGGIEVFTVLEGSQTPGTLTS